MINRLATLLSIGCLGLTTALLIAQEPVEVNDNDAHLWDHVIGPREAIHADRRTLGLAPYEMFGSHVELEVVVSGNGRVDQAHAIRGPKQLYDRAEQIEMSRTFKPFKREGIIITAKIHDYVSIEPPEEWLPVSVPFPAEIDRSTVSISLSRTACYGSCPSYSITLTGDGVIIFDGTTNVLIPGHHTARVSTDVVRDLLAAFRKADFLSAKDSYRAMVTDNPTQTLTLNLNGHIKTVMDYVGSEAGLPDEIKDLERQTDEAADTERWVKGNSQTLASLKAEHWDFGSGGPDNMALYGSAISSDNSSLIGAFLAAKAPVDMAGTKTSPVAPICVATGKADPTLVHRMLALRKSISKEVLQPCLAAAARSGDVALLNLWLDREANPVAKASEMPGDWNSFSIFSNGLTSGKAAVVQRLLDYPVDLRELVNGDTPLITWAMERGEKSSELDQIILLLVKAGADVNQRGHMGQTPLFAAEYHPSAVRTLIAAGALIDARDEGGNTALIYQPWMLDYARELLTAGADPTLSAKNGDTALKKAKQFNCQPCVDLIEDALKRKSQHLAR